MSSGPSYCGYYARGRCKFGKNCRYSHDEKDSPAVRKQLLETKLQLSLICVLCNVKIVESGNWFGLNSSCSHPFCYPCAEKKSIKSKAKKSKKIEEKSCPECQEPIGKICPSGLFLEDLEKKKKAFEYYDKHEAGIWETYLNRDRRTAKCGFSNCSKSIFLDDGTEICAHGQFNQKDLHESIQKKNMEKQKRIEHNLRIDWINKTAKVAKDAFLFFFASTIFLVVFVFLVRSIRSFEIPLQDVKFYNNIPEPTAPMPDKSSFAAYPEIRIKTYWVGDDGFGDDFRKLKEAKNSNDVDPDINDKEEMCLYISFDNYNQLCDSDGGFDKNFNY